MFPLTLPPPPMGARTTIGVVETDLGPGVELTWRTVGGPALPAMLVSMLSPFVGVSVFMLVGVLITRPAGLTTWHVLFLAAIIAILLFLVLTIIDAWRFSRQVLTLTRGAISYRRSSPLLDRTMGLARTLLCESSRTWSIPMTEFEGIRVVDDDQLHLRTTARDTRPRICIIHLPAPEEPAWIARCVRELARTL